MHLLCICGAVAVCVCSYSDVVVLLWCVCDPFAVWLWCGCSMVVVLTLQNECNYSNSTVVAVHCGAVVVWFLSWHIWMAHYVS